MPSCTSSAASRHSLLIRLQKLTLPFTSIAEQRKIVNTLYEIKLSILEECLLQICHICITHPHPEMQEPLRNFVFWLASKSLYLALRLSWCVDAVFSFFMPTTLCDRVRDMQDSIESYAINQMTYHPHCINNGANSSNNSNSKIIRRTKEVANSEIKGKDDITNKPEYLRSDGESKETESTDKSSNTQCVLQPTINSQSDNSAANSKIQGSNQHSEITNNYNTNFHNNSNNNKSNSNEQTELPPMETAKVSMQEKYQHQRQSCVKNHNANSKGVSTNETISDAHPQQTLTDANDEVYTPTDVLRKERRLKLFTDERQFINTLTDISHFLRAFPERARRKSELHNRLREINTCLPHMLLIHPLGSSNEAVCWIVNIVVEECTVFSSRTRAPYLIRYEVIVDDTTTMSDPTQSLLRRNDGQFELRPFHVTTKQRTSSAVATTTTTVASSSSSSSLIAQVMEDEFNSPYLKRAFGQSLSQRTASIGRRSKWGRHPNWAIRSLIVKAGDDLRQEELALQVVNWFATTWHETGITCLANPYQVISTSADCGVVEVVENSSSVDAIKKSCGVNSLWQFFVKAYNGEGSTAYEHAQRNFVETMAAYSVISYILQVKDRHNGNLMISRFGHLTHIDFGYLIATSPGNLNFESAPFKLSQELVDVMGGVYGDAFKYYKVLVYQALETIRVHADDVVILIKLMLPFNTMPCFGTDPHNAIGLLRGRFRYDLPSGVDYALYIRELITNSIDNWRTRRYDQFQTLQNGIL